MLKKLPTQTNIGEKETNLIVNAQQTKRMSMRVKANKHGSARLSNVLKGDTLPKNYDLLDIKKEGQISEVVSETSSVYPQAEYAPDSRTRLLARPLRSS